MTTKYPHMEWKRGQRADIAQAAGISRQHLSNILNKRKNAKADLAIRLEQASAAIGQFISRHEWAFATTTDHPLFGKQDHS